MYYKTDLMDNILKSDKAKEIIDWISPVYGRAYAFLWLIQIIGYTLDCLTGLTEDYLLEVVPQTAKNTLSLWESEYGVEYGSYQSEDQRRKNILYKIMHKAPITPAKLASMVENITGQTVQIFENTGTNHFSVILIGTQEENTNLAKEIIDKSKPAHLSYDFSIAELVDIEHQDTTYYGGSVNIIETITI